jgi:protein disulfide isomerase family A protein 3
MVRLFLLLALVAIVFATEPLKEDGVVVLTDDTFKDFIAKEDLVLAEFYAPWCGHCKRLAPEYAVAAKELATANPPVALAKIDCTVHKKVCERYGVSGYPTLKVFRNGESSDYRGPRVAAGIVKHMAGLVGPSSLEVTTVDEAERYVPDPTGEGVAKVIIFGFFKQKDSDYEKFMDIAEEWRGKFTFIHTSNEEVLRRYGARHTFVVFRPFDTPSRVQWPDDRAISRTGMKEFVAKYGLPLAGELTEENQELYRAREGSDLTFFTTVDFKNNAKKMNYYLNRLRKVAVMFENVSFTIADKTKFKQIYERFSFTQADADADIAIGMYQTSKDVRWKFDGPKFGVKEIEGFIQRVHTGLSAPYTKSESTPQSNPKAGEGKVVTVTANTFKMVVQDTSKDALIELYAPWCGHCKKLTPIYELLAAEYKGVEDIVIAKMDATANDTPPGYTASGFPTIYWAPKTNKVSPVKYTGERTVDAFKKFIRDNKGR